MDKLEARRSARIATTFLAAVDGIDDAPSLRRGDISATGVYFATDRDVGGPGSIHWLTLVSLDDACRVHVMAYVVRRVDVDEGSKRIRGVAFEFMPESDEAAATLHAFVRYVLAPHDDTAAPRVASRLDARVGETDDATVRQLSVRSMVLETSWAIQPGEKVRVDIVAPGMTRRIRLEGRAVRVEPKSAAEAVKSNARFDIEVLVQEETERPLRTFSSMTMKAVPPAMEADARARANANASTHAMQTHARGPRDTLPDDDETSRTLDDLLAALILPPERDSVSRKRREHLSGELARIRLPTLFALFEMEKMTGKLVLRHDIEETRLWLREGQILDVEPIADGETRRARIGALLARNEGSFEFTMQAVDRPNLVEVSTTALLIDLAREEDEAKAR